MVWACDEKRVNGSSKAVLKMNVEKEDQKRDSWIRLRAI